MTRSFRGDSRGDRRSGALPGPCEAQERIFQRQALVCRYVSFWSAGRIPIAPRSRVRWRRAEATLDVPGRCTRIQGKNERVEAFHRFDCSLVLNLRRMPAWWVPQPKKVFQRCLDTSLKKNQAAPSLHEAKLMGCRKKFLLQLQCGVHLKIYRIPLRPVLFRRATVASSATEILLGHLSLADLCTIEFSGPLIWQLGHRTFWN